ncbi:MAG TPA: acetyltransferase [Chitinophagaceae bacterium]|nr:acetyltransferase [Chitinophagaceae bacterium]
MNKEYCLYGASGHGKVIIEILEAMGIKIDGIFDDNDSIKSLINYPVQKFSQQLMQDKKMIVSIGNNLVRKKIVNVIIADYGIARHPSSIISPRCTLGEGSVIMAGVTINVNTRIGKHCIINTNSTVDHDCTLEDFVHISPNATLCGDVAIGEGSHIGASCVIIPGKKIGKYCIIGAGSVIIDDIPDFAVAVGNPGKIIKNILEQQ